MLRHEFLMGYLVIVLDNEHDTVSVYDLVMDRLRQENYSIIYVYHLHGKFAIFTNVPEKEIKIIERLLE